MKEAFDKLEQIKLMTEKLPLEFKIKWISALEKLKQCKSTLYNGEKYCVLGAAYYAAYNKTPSHGRGNINQGDECIPKELTGNAKLLEGFICANDIEQDPATFEEFKEWIEENL